MSMKNPLKAKPLELDVTNFGPIVEAKIELRPLTVFVGPSNTGKSYLAILIYALHRFFGVSTLGIGYGHRMMRRFLQPSFLRSLEDLNISDADIESLWNWMRDLASESTNRKRQQDSRILVPDDIAALIRPVFKHMQEFADVFDTEIRRCFGVDETRQLIRHPGKNGATVTLRNHVQDDEEPFAYQFSTRGKAPKFTASIPDTTPLQIERGRERLLRSFSRFARFDRENRERRDVEPAIMDIIWELWESIFPYIIGEVYRPAHYLPADRTGVMHAHRVVVRSLIEGATSAGLRPTASMPTLSGVMADFLEQLIEFDDTPRRSHNRNRDLARDLEENILSGAVSVEKPDINYPRFFYTPQGWKETKALPLMNASSMVSELAPLVLYLRHIVAPGDLLIIEEPESHLHPAMQAAFARQLAQVVKAGIRVIVTTHSEWVLDQFANLVRLSALPQSKRKEFPEADAALRPDQFGAWLFKPKQRPKGSVVEEIRIDPEAGGLLADYSEIADQLYNTWAEIGNRITESQGGRVE